MDEGIYQLSIFRAHCSLVRRVTKYAGERGGSRSHEVCGREGRLEESICLVHRRLCCGMRGYRDGVQGV